MKSTRSHFFCDAVRTCKLHSEFGKKTKILKIFFYCDGNKFPFGERYARYAFDYHTKHNHLTCSDLEIEKFLWC